MINFTRKIIAVAHHFLPVQHLADAKIWLWLELRLGLAPVFWLAYTWQSALTASQSKSTWNRSKFNICKELCTENDCNTQEITREPQCYECQVTVDHHNQTVGYGDTRFIINRLFTDKIYFRSFWSNFRFMSGLNILFSCWDGKQLLENLVPCASGKCHTGKQGSTDWPDLTKISILGEEFD